ncbi:MAG TPA: hypothetical protein VHC69_20425 [Polyangiaceae bacterium]|nr:hypothetical protein [Polyangiaceae bacterium]
MNVLVSREGGAFHVDTLELYSARQRAQYTTLASGELGVEERVVKRDLGEVLLRLEELVEQRGRESEQVKELRPPAGVARPYGTRGLQRRASTGRLAASPAPEPR